MKTFISTVTLLMICTITLFPQNRRETLVLKNGSLVIGKLLEVSSDRYRIRTSDGSIFVFAPEEVESYHLATIEREVSDRGNFGLGMEAGFMIGSQSSQYVTPFGFNIIGTYRASEIHSLSLGSGIEFLGVSYSPLFLEYRANLYNRPATPFMFFRAGAVIYTGGSSNEDIYSYYYNNDERDYHGGPTLTIGTGINWQRENYDMALSFGFRYIKTGYKLIEYNSSESTYDTDWKRLEVKLGFWF